PALCDRPVAQFIAQITLHHAPPSFPTRRSSDLRRVDERTPSNGRGPRPVCRVSFNHLPLLFGTCLLVLAVGGCSDDVAEPDAAGGGSGIGADDPPATIDPLRPPGTEAPAGSPAGGIGAPTNAARFDGYGPARFGMGADTVRAAWAGEL